jgi:hypothetical protein
MELDGIDIKKLMNDLTEVALKLSVDYTKKLIEGTAEKDELRHINEIKKHLSFAKKTYKEMNPTENKSKSVFTGELFKKIKAIESSVGEIVQSMRE